MNAQPKPKPQDEPQADPQTTPDTDDDDWDFPEPPEPPEQKKSVNKHRQIQTLTQRQLNFAAEYVSDPLRNATQAAIRAGYSPRGADRTAHRTLSQVEVQLEIQRLEQKLTVKSSVSAEDVIDGIRNTIDLAIKAGMLSVAVRGWELLGKTHGIFREVTETIDNTDTAKRLARAHSRLEKKKGQLIGNQLASDDKVLNIKDLKKTNSLDAAMMQQDDGQSDQSESNEPSEVAGS